MAIRLVARTHMLNGAPADEYMNFKCRNAYIDYPQRYCFRNYREYLFCCCCFWSWVFFFIFFCCSFNKTKQRLSQRWWWGRFLFLSYRPSSCLVFFSSFVLFSFFEKFMYWQWEIDIIRLQINVIHICVTMLHASNRTCIFISMARSAWQTLFSLSLP